MNTLRRLTEFDIIQLMKEHPRDAQQLLIALKDIELWRQDQYTGLAKFTNGSGICANLSHWDQVHRKDPEDLYHKGIIFAQLAQVWPFFSQDRWYPVPSTVRGESAQQTYENQPNKWGKTRYGMDRVRLLHWCIEFLEKHPV